MVGLLTKPTLTTSCMPVCVNVPPAPLLSERQIMAGVVRLVVRDDVLIDSEPAMVDEVVAETEMVAIDVAHVGSVYTPYTVVPPVATSAQPATLKV